MPVMQSLHGKTLRPEPGARRFTTGAFLRIKLGAALARRGIETAVSCEPG